jgi:hypothetical protein
VLTFGDDRSHAGNLGYQDDPNSLYRYDSDVQNHMRVAVGDVLLIRNRHALLGIASIGEIRSKDQTKTRQRCPECGTAKLAERTTSRTRFRCMRGHEFDSPTREEDTCTAYEAEFASFVHAVDAIPIEALRAACPRYTSQASIQLIEPDGVRWGLEAAVPEAAALLPATASGDVIPLASDAEANGEDWTSHADERELVNRAIRLRRGQAAFRRALLNRYGARCMVSGCELLDIVEAAHIAPYRGLADNAPVNGLLLRSDLHTLFDLELLGFEPDSLRIRLHPLAAITGYSQFAGRDLACGQARPSASALRARWNQFQNRIISTV